VSIDTPRAADPQPESVPAVSIVVPVYNEEATIGAVVTQLLAVPMSAEVVVIDDGSSDGTAQVLEAFAGRVVYRRLERNQGKGAALRYGFALARGQVVVVQDADLELSPHLVVELAAPILSGVADVVYGSRFLTAAHAVPWARRLANRFLTQVTNLLYGTRLTDMETAHKAVRADLLPRLDLRSDRFEIEVELTTKLARSDARFHEIASPYSPRSRDEGKKIGFSDGLLALRALMRYLRWRPAASRPPV